MLKELATKYAPFGGIFLGTIQVYEFCKNIKKDHVDAARDSAAMLQNTELKQTLAEQRDVIISESVIKGKIEATMKYVHSQMQQAVQVNNQIAIKMEAAKNTLPEVLSSEAKSQILAEVEELRIRGSHFLHFAEKSNLDMQKWLSNIDKSDIMGDIIAGTREFYNAYQNYSDSLTTMQHASFANILFCISILFCVFNLISIFMGDRIITYFQLESKYPRLNKLFYYRRRIQLYYFVLNSFIIVLSLLVLIILNLYILLYT